MIVKVVNKIFECSAAGDLSSYSKLRQHYTTEYKQETQLFTVDSRSAAVRRLYEQARGPAHTQVITQPTTKIQNNLRTKLLDSSGVAQH